MKDIAETMAHVKRAMQVMDECEVILLPLGDQYKASAARNSLAEVYGLLAHASADGGRALREARAKEEQERIAYVTAYFDKLVDKHNAKLKEIR